MHAARSAAGIGRLLLALGLVVGVAASVGLLVGFEPATLPPGLLNVAADKLSVVAVLGLFAAGAVCLRYARAAGSGATVTRARAHRPSEVAERE